MSEDPLALVYDFEADLTAFGDLVDARATEVVRESSQITGEAITFGNPYGPGVPVDTAWARSSFAAGLNQPAATRGERPYVSRKVNPAGRVLFPEAPDLSAILNAQLGDVVFITTAAGYPAFLEFQPGRRRYGENKGASTEFLAPVEARFPQLVADVVAHVTGGDA